MTLHLDQRMNQRGISRELLHLVLTHGNWIGDRCVLDRKTIQSLLCELEKLKRTAIRAMDKGGLVVVEVDGKEITTYALPRRRGLRRK